MAVERSTGKNIDSLIFPSFIYLDAAARSLFWHSFGYERTSVIDREEKSLS